jgi:hypothetical protein
MSEFEKYIDALVKGEEVEDSFPKNESSWEELFDFGVARIAEIVALRKMIETLNQQVSVLVDKNDRMEAHLEAISAWGDAYPLIVFPEPDFKKVRELLEAGGITLDCVSASNMRHVVEGVAKIAREGLGETASLQRVCEKCGASMWANAIEVNGKEICTKCGWHTRKAVPPCVT